MDEFARISRYFAPLAQDEAALGLRDDAALLTGGPYVLTKDCMVAGVHFIGDEPPDSLARKLLRVNLSDLAAMGAEPAYYLLGLMAPKDTDEAWFAAFAHGLAIDQDVFGLTLLGGDTTATPGPLCLSLTAIGRVEGRPLRRDGARVGDAVYVTGTLGDAAAGLLACRGEIAANDALIARYRLPEPRVQASRALRAVASACMDISDGLVQDMGHIAHASGVGVVLDAAALPASPALLTCGLDAGQRIAAMAAGGDDYELLFTAPQGLDLSALGGESGVAITRIGSVVEGNGVQLHDAEGLPIMLAHRGYRHF